MLKDSIWRHRTLSILLGLLLIIAPAHAALSDGLESYWAFENSSAADSHSTFPFTVVGATHTTGVNQYKLGAGAFLLDGVNDDLTTATYTPFSGFNKDSIWSVSMWVRAQDLTQDAQAYFTHTTSDNHVVGMNIQTGTDKLNWWQGSGDLASNTTFDDTTNWQHIVLVHRGSNGTEELYQNARSLGTGSDARPYSATVINIGDINTGGWEANFYIDELAIWTRQLSTDEIQQLYNGGAGTDYNSIVGGTADGINISGNIYLTAGFPTGLVGEFYHNETSGNIVFNWSDQTGGMDTAWFDTYIINGSGKFFNFANFSTATGGTLYYNITSIIAGGDSISAKAYINDSNRTYIHGNTVFVGSLFIAGVSNLISNIPKPDGAIYSAFVLLMMMLIGVAMRSPSLTLIFGTAGFVVASHIILDWNVAFTFLAGFLSLMVLWVISRVRSD